MYCRKGKLYYGLIVNNFELHQNESERSCRHLEFCVVDDKSRTNILSLNYKPGDHIAVFPANDLCNVNKLGRLLNIDLDVIFQLVDTQNGFCYYIIFELIYSKYFFYHFLERITIIAQNKILFF